MKSGLKRLARRILPDSVKSFLFQASLAVMDEKQKHATRIAYEMASMKWSLRNIAMLGFHPQVIVDVGAYQGQWTLMTKAIFPEARILMVEAQQSKEPLLEQVCAQYPTQVTCHLGLLGPEHKENVPFYELETGSSVLPEQSNIKRDVVSYTMETLDEVVAKSALGKVDLLKLDVQGYELEVLKGGAKTLQDAEVVLMEVALLGVNKGAPLLSDVVLFVKERGLVAYDICSFIRRPLDNALWQSDFLFVKETSPLRQNQTFGL